MKPIAFPDAERLSQILLRVAAGLGMLLIAVVANALLHSEGEALNPVAEAAERTQETPGARLAIEAIYTSPSLAQPIVANGHGVYNAHSGRARASIEIPNSLTHEQMVSVGDDSHIYLHSPEIAADLPAGKRWLGVEPWLNDGGSATIGGSGGAKDQLEMLRAVDPDVDEIGDEAVRGVPTKRYRCEIELDRLAAMLAAEGKTEAAQLYESLARKEPDPIETEVWIDSRGIVRKERMITDLPTTGGGPTLTMDMRIELFDFGISPAIPLPDQGEVFDATPLARANLDLLDGSAASRRLIHPTGAPLETSAFRRRGNALCRTFTSRAKALLGSKLGLLDAIKRASGPEQMRAAMQRAGSGFYAPVWHLEERAIRKLARLRPPPQLSTAFNQFLDHNAVELEVIEAETRAMEVADLKNARNLEDRRRQISEEGDRSALALGLPACASGGDADATRA